MATFKRPSAGCSPCLTIACILIGCLVTLPNPAAAAGRGAAAPGRRLSQSTPAPPPSPDASLAAPSDCSKWLNERRMYVEGQAWFTRAGADINVDSSHLHVGACVPHRQRVKGTIPLHVIVQKHQFPNNGSATEPVSVRIEFSTDVGNRTQLRYIVRDVLGPTNWTCGPNPLLCKAVLPFNIDTYVGTLARTRVPDGVTRMTLIANSSLDDGRGRRSIFTHISTFILVDNRGNGAWPINGSVGLEQLSTTGFPWGYTHAPFTSDVPTAPVPATWRFNVENFLANGAASTANVTDVFISIDPNFHKPDAANFTGKIILVNNTTGNMRKQCPLKAGMTPRCNMRNITVDTTKLDKGMHKLFIRTDSFVAPDHPELVSSGTGVGGTFSAITLFTFPVCNDPDPANCSSSLPPPMDDPSVVVPPLVPITPPAGTTWYTPDDTLPDPMAVVNSPLDCSVWRGQRAYLQAESWLTPPGNAVGKGSAQLRIGACLPHKQPVAGVVPLDIVVTKHNFPMAPIWRNVTLDMKIALEWNGGNISLELSQTNNDRLVAWSCLNSATTCNLAFRVLLDTRPYDRRWFLPDGLATLKLQAKANMAGGATNRSFTTRLESWLVISNNDATDVSGTNAPPAAETKTDFPWKAQVANLTSGLPPAPAAGAVPVAAKASVNGNTGANVTGAAVQVDPAWLPASPTAPAPGAPLSTDAALTLLNASMPTPGARLWPRPPGCKISLSGVGSPLNCSWALQPAAAAPACPLNPCRGGLCDGPHRLAVRVDSSVPPDSPMMQGAPVGFPPTTGTLSTLLTVPLSTQNGNARDTTLCAQKAPAVAKAAVAAAAAPAPPVVLVTAKAVLSAARWDE